MITPITLSGVIPKKAVADEGGFMIILSLLVLFTLTLMGMTSLIDATIQTKIAANENNGSKALFCADAGLNHALTELNNNGITITTGDYSDVNWNYPDSSDTGTGIVTEDGRKYVFNSNNDQGWLYRWYMHFRQDIEDLDGDGDTDELVYFNNNFGYPTSLFPGVGGDNGFPVIEVISEGYVGSSRISERRLALELGRNQFDVSVEGSLTSRSSVEVSGNITIDGTNHDLEGNPGGSCGSDMPGVFVDSGMSVTQSGSSDIAGNPPSEVNDGSVTLPDTPWDVLGIDPEDMDNVFDKIDAAAVGHSVDMYDGNIWVYNVTYGTTLHINQDTNTGGILLVHNENFVPDVWEVSCPTSPDYDTMHGDYDPRADPSDPSFEDSYSPAVFQINGNATFKGVIIADSVLRMNGNATIIGAVISLSTLGVQNVGTGSADILYSCEAITQATTQGYSTKLVWRKL